MLLPVLSARETLPAALDDILGQIGVAVRVVAVVDEPPGGDDGSTAWLEARAWGEPRLEVLRGPGRGAAAALQLGLEACEAALVSHMEADDRCPPERLARLAQALADGRDDRGRPLAAITSRVEQLGDHSPGMQRYLDWQNGLGTYAELARERFVEIPALHQTGLYRREALVAAGGYVTRGAWPVDIDFWLRWFEHDLPVAKLADVLYGWRQHPGQSTRGGGSHDLATLRACKLDALRRLHGRDGARPREVVLVGTGESLRAWSEGLRAHDVDVTDEQRWKPGMPAPTVDDGALLMAVYGMPRARRALRAALRAAGDARHEPDGLLFVA